MAPKGQPFRLRQLHPKGPTLTAQYDPASVKPSGGIGGWNEILRPRRDSSTEWTGRPARRLSFTMIFDEWEDNRSIEHKLQVLKSMGEPTGHRKPPPRLAVDYGPVGRGSLWVIDTIDWGDELRNRDHERVAQDVTITLLGFVDDEVNLSPAEKHRHKRKNDDEKSKAPSSRIYTVKGGDTLSSIAASILGDVSRWTEIGDLNGIRDPLAVTTGQTLKLPA